jgi:D-glycero-D-manno-heptose 1,7-bisphosphate phosphatase
VALAAVFLDKDGTLIDDLPYNVDPTLITLAPGAIDALKDLRDAGFVFIVVSNQPGVARGRFPLTALDRVEAELGRIFATHGLQLTACYWCPHDPQGCVDPFARACDCRKPAPGLIAAAAKRHDVDVTRSWMIGDILDDVEAGHRAGCRTVFLDNGHETQWRRSPMRTPDVVASSFAEAAAAILADVPRSIAPSEV